MSLAVIIMLGDGSAAVEPGAERAMLTHFATGYVIF